MAQEKLNSGWVWICWSGRYEREQGLEDNAGINFLLREMNIKVTWTNSPKNKIQQAQRSIDHDSIKLHLLSQFSSRTGCCHLCSWCLLTCPICLQAGSQSSCGSIHHQPWYGTKIELPSELKHLPTQETCSSSPQIHFLLSNFDSKVHTSSQRFVLCLRPVVRLQNRRITSSQT